MPEHKTPLEKAWDDCQNFFNKWGLTKEEISKILNINEEVYVSWMLSGAMSLGPKIVLRCDECYALHEALLLHFPQNRAYAWVRRPNTASLFRGRTAVQTICQEIEKNPLIIREIADYVRATAIR